MSTLRRSPVQCLLESQGAELRDFCGASFAVHVQPGATEARALESLAICDVSGLQKLGVKGRDAAAWLHSLGLDVPSQVLDTKPLPHGGQLVKSGLHEFFLEDGITNGSLPKLIKKADSHRGELVRIAHEEGTFLLIGSRAAKVLAQTCAVNFREVPAGRFVFTRVAGVNCGVLSETMASPGYRLWVDPSYAVYLWMTLVEICESLDGCVIGAGCLYPELLR